MEYPMLSAIFCHNLCVDLWCLLGLYWCHIFLWCRYASSFLFMGDYLDMGPVDSMGRRKTRIVAIDALCKPGMRQYRVKGLLRYVKNFYSWDGNTLLEKLQLCIGLKENIFLQASALCWLNWFFTGALSLAAICDTHLISTWFFIGALSVAVMWHAYFTLLEYNYFSCMLLDF